MAQYGYADEKIEPMVDRQNEVVGVARFWWSNKDEIIVDGRLKSALVEESD